MKNVRKRLFTTLISVFFSYLSIAQSDFIDTGVASYYAKKFHGRKTASGEIYDKNKLTAAHPTLPFNTLVKVTNLTNKSSVTVRINDRGPFTKQRIIDLSKAAAARIGMIQSGTAKVKLEIVSEKEDNKPVLSNTSSVSGSKELKSGKYYTTDNKEITLKGYLIQSSSFSDLKKANTYIHKLKKSGYKEIYIEPASVKKKKVYRVLIGSFDSRQKAEAELKILKKKGYTGFVKSSN